MRLLVPILSSLLLLAPGARAEEDQRPPRTSSGPRSGRFTYGGSVGFGFASGIFAVSLRGEVGYLVTDRLWTGVSGRFQYTVDDRYEGSDDFLDYGGGAYARYFVVDRLFAATEWGWTSYEVRTVDSSSSRENLSSVLVGAGYGQPLGPRSALVVELLYDVTGNARGLYGTPWVTRLSFTTGF